MLKTKKSQNLSVEDGIEVAKESSQQRQLLFISHANPEDNSAAAWFATQLSLMGYEVWCDLKNTSGGESDFWLKVQKKIENEAAKFIFILSNTSRDFEKKKGVYKEVQAASNTGQDNFILPVRIENLDGSLPIMIGTDLYINGENWAEGLRELQKRLDEDGVPRNQTPDMEKIASWWPAISAKDALVEEEEDAVTSNVFPFKALPGRIHFLKVGSENNPLTGHKILRKVLPIHPAHSAHSDYAISFGCAHDFLELTSGYDIEDAIILQTKDFLEYGHEPLNITPQSARNIATYLVASALEKYLEGRKLENKPVSGSNRKIWFPAYGLVKDNRHSFAEPSKRKSPAWFVGKVSHYKKTFVWHFGVQPIIDLHTHLGVILSPKVVLSLPYRSDRGEAPIPVDEKKAVKKLSWWNKEWRRKTLGLAQWIADDQVTIRIPAGYQEILLASEPEIFTSPQTYLEKGNDELIEEILGWCDD